MYSRKLKISLALFASFIFFLIAFSCTFVETDILATYHDYILILNSTGNVIVPYDVTLSKFKDQPIPVGPSENTNYAPQQILSSADEEYYYVVNSLDNSVSKFTRNLSFVQKYTLPAGTNPYNAFIDGDYMYISGNASGKVVKLNLNDGTIKESSALYTSNIGIQAIAKLNSEYLMTINTNYNLSNYSYDDSIIYILKMNTLEKVKEQSLDTTFIGYNLKNFQQVYVHEHSGEIYCDLISTGDYGFTQSSGFLRIKIDLSNLNITKISYDKLPSGEYFGSKSSIYNGYLYTISNKSIYRLPVDSSAITFVSGVDKNSNVGAKSNLSLIHVGDLVNSQYIAIVNTPWGSLSSFSFTNSFTNLVSQFSNIIFTNFYEFSGYPVSIIFRKSK